MNKNVIPYLSRDIDSYIQACNKKLWKYGIKEYIKIMDYHPFYISISFVKGDITSLDYHAEPQAEDYIFGWYKIKAPRIPDIINFIYELVNKRIMSYYGCE